MKRSHLLLSLCLAVSLPTLHASQVRVWGESLGSFTPTINNFYNSIPGTTSQIIGGTLDSNNLTGVNLLWATQPADDYTAAELTSMANLLSAGGRIAFLGEHGGFAPAQNVRINAALLALGSTISIQTNTIHDAGFRNASVGDGQILNHPLTAGVNIYTYAAYAPLNVAGTAQILMIGEDQPSIMMAYQNIGPGSIFLITDQNVWDFGVVSDTFGNDNHQMFENLLLGNTGAPPPPGGQVPEPSTMLLTAAGGMLLLVIRRRTR